jgi:hypothetical protein
MEIIVPAAGLSTRFPDMKPKYLLYDYGQKLMIQRALEPYIGQHPITIGILKEHDEKFHASETIRYEIGDNVKIVILDKVTNGPADTAYQIIKKGKINPNADILIKDCDSFFDNTLSTGPNNFVCVSRISHHDVLKRVASKSFVISNEQGIITDIVEKNVVSDTFCVGGYKFASAQLYIQMFKEISSVKEIFVSDVIQRCLFHKYIFMEKVVDNYIDVGTSDEWFDYNDKPVIFCDIDGTIIKNQGRVGKNNYSDDIVPLTKSVQRLLQLQSDGAQFVFTTSRPKDFLEKTDKFLTELGFVNYTLIAGLQNSRRILINDFNNNNPFPRAQAINVRRDSDELQDYL